MSDLSVFTQCSDKAIDLHLPTTETRHCNGSLAVGITVGSNLQREPVSAALIMASVRGWHCPA